MRRSTAVLIIYMMACFIFIGAASSGPLHGQEWNVDLSRIVADCETCHSCPEPSDRNPCLLDCPRPFKIEGKPVPADRSPEIVILDELEDMYVPVVFAHKLHAGMSKIGSGCTLCHHYTPTDQSHPPCKECHSPGPTNGNLQQPGLKGAYHRQCMNCHREWSHDTECEVCHVKKAGGALAPLVRDQSDIVGVEHPIIHEPETRVYETGYEKGPVVTFHHEEHIQLFDLKCVDCHKEENCSRCHDLGKTGEDRSHDKDFQRTQSALLRMS